MTEQFICDLKASPYFSRILAGHDVVMVALTGSRLIDITDERSDFDLMVITNGGEREESVSEFLTYCSKKVHWHYIPITKLIGNEDGNLLSCVGEAEFAGLCDGKIIYADPKYTAAVDFLKANKDVVAVVGSYGLVRFLDKLIAKILSANEIKREDHCKFIYHLCCASYALLSETPDKAFLSAVKRIRWRPVSDEYKSLAVERIRALHNYVKKHPLDLKGTIDAFNQRVGMLLR